MGVAVCFYCARNNTRLASRESVYSCGFWMNLEPCAGYTSVSIHNFFASTCAGTCVVYGHALCVCVCVCVCVCMRACVLACVRACVRAYACVRARGWVGMRVHTIYLFIYLLNIFKQGITYRQNQCLTMLPCT